MFFEDIIFDSSMKNNVSDSNPSLFSEKDGFMYGNMFKSLYTPYKNYRVSKLDAASDKGELILKIYEYDFALNDLSLYLDLHPEDDSVYRLFRKYTEEARKCVAMYEKRYGPLELTESDYESYMWDNGPWPFEGGKV